MADQKYSQATDVTTPTGTLQWGVDESGTSKALSLAQVATYLQTIGMPRVKALAANHAISSTTATEVTGLGPMTLEAGTYFFRFALVVQSATAGVVPLLGLNFTGTSTLLQYRCEFSDKSGTLLAAIGTMAGESITITTGVGFHMSQTGSAESTTAPNMGPSTGPATINQNCYMNIEGLLIVTVSGDLELWHGSETNTSTTVMAGSSLIVTRTV